MAVNDEEKKFFFFDFFLDIYGNLGDDHCKNLRREDRPKKNERQISGDRFLAYPR